MRRWMPRHSRRTARGRRDRFQAWGATPHRGRSPIPVLRRGSGRSARSLGVKPILSKRADCRSTADGGVHAGGGVAVEKDENQRSRRARDSAASAPALQESMQAERDARTGCRRARISLCEGSSIGGQTTPVLAETRTLGARANRRPWHGFAVATREVNLEVGVLDLAKRRGGR
jgi:hypothetical protein